MNKQINTRSGVKGYYRVQVLDKDRNVKRDTGWFPNLITDRGLDYLCSLYNELNGRPQYLIARCTVGTGSATPAASDLHLAGTVLGTVIAYNFASVWVSTPEYYAKMTNTYEFALGAVVGNVAEVGLGPSNYVLTSPYDDLFSRALIVDGLGAPTTITVLSDEILRVFYELRCYCDMASDETYSIDISGVPYDIVMRPSELGNVNMLMNGPFFVNNTGGGYTDCAQTYSTNVLGAKTASPATTGGYDIFNAVSVNTYSLGDHYRDMILTVPVGNGNYAGGIGAARFGSFFGKWQMNFSPKIPKTNLKILTLTFRHTFARI